MCWIVHDEFLNGGGGVTHAGWDRHCVGCVPIIVREGITYVVKGRRTQMCVRRRGNVNPGQTEG